MIWIYLIIVIFVITLILSFYNTDPGWLLIGTALCLVIFTIGAITTSVINNKTSINDMQIVNKETIELLPWEERGEHTSNIYGVYIKDSRTISINKINTMGFSHTEKLTVDSDEHIYVQKTHCQKATCEIIKYDLKTPLQRLFRIPELVNTTYYYFTIPENTMIFYS